MTEKKWFSCNDPHAMLELVRNTASERKLRLFACACCRRIWHLCVHESSRRAIEVGERFADGAASGEELARALDDADNILGIFLQLDDSLVFDPSDLTATAEELEPHRSTISAAGISIYAAYNAADAVLATVKPESSAEEHYYPGAYGTAAWAVAGASSESSDEAKNAEDVEAANQCDLLRDILGNPFRPVTVDPRWLTSTVIDLATVIYEERAFDKMPILADALMDAGCDNEDIIAHCRSEGPHVRGCWVVDLLLAKE